MKMILSIIGLFLLSSFSTPPARGILTLKISNIEKTTGMIWVGVYDSQDNFMIQEKANLVEGFHVLGGRTLEVRLPYMPFGTYAVALFHDENNNGFLDQNWIGIPVEPYAFSERPPSKWRVPRFEELKFDFQNPQQVLETELERW